MISTLEASYIVLENLALLSMAVLLLFVGKKWKFRGRRCFGVGLVLIVIQKFIPFLTVFVLSFFQKELILEFDKVMPSIFLVVGAGGFFLVFVGVLMAFKDVRKL
jgi:hypothetical protein